MTNVDDLVSPMRETAKQICEEFPAEYWRDNDRERAYPSGFVQALTDAGLLACLIPEEYGGSGLPLSFGAQLMQAIHEFGANASACHAQMYTMSSLLNYGSSEQKRKYLPRIASGELRLQAFGVTEPNAGTDTTRITTTAVRQGDDYLINGQKVWISRAEHSDLMILLARTRPRCDGQKKSEGLSVFLLDMEHARENGMTIRPLRTMINHATTEIFFDNLSIPSSCLIGEEGQGFKIILSAMNAERILIASECIGDAYWFINKASDYAGNRQVFGRPIGQNQGIQFPIARCYAQTFAAEQVVNRAARNFSSGHVENKTKLGSEANMAKLLASEASWAAADMCLQTHGGFGMAEEYDVERKFRETRLYQIAPISTNLILAYLAEHELGLPRSY